MQELSCTVRGNHYKLPAPFFVLATQNPIELEGHVSAARSAVRPLPLQYRARLPRPRGRTAGGRPDHDHGKPGPEPVTNAEEILEFQQLVRMVPIAEGRALRGGLVRATRNTDASLAGFREEVRELRRQRARHRSSSCSPPRPAR
jgi:MoxR-like ATPase